MRICFHSSNLTVKDIAPSLTQMGITASCNKFAKAASGVRWTDFAMQNGVTTAQLYQWNTVMGTDGANCNTMVWAGEWYCIGVLTVLASATFVTKGATLVIPYRGI